MHLTKGTGNRHSMKRTAESCPGSPVDVVVRVTSTRDCTCGLRHHVATCRFPELDICIQCLSFSGEANLSVTWNPKSGWGFLESTWRSWRCYSAPFGLKGDDSRFPPLLHLASRVRTFTPIWKLGGLTIRDNFSIRAVSLASNFQKKGLLITFRRRDR